MAFVLVSTEHGIESGPTVVGDRNSDPDLMKSLNATPIIPNMGAPISKWATDECPRLVLNKLAGKGYRVVGMAGVKGTYPKLAWTLFKE